MGATWKLSASEFRKDSPSQAAIRKKFASCGDIAKIARSSPVECGKLSMSRPSVESPSTHVSDT